VTMDVHGNVAAGWEPVADAFRDNFETRGEVGASLCVHLDGEPVVDVWAGIADPSTGEPYGEHTCQVVCSTTKAVLAICAGMLVQEGLLDIDKPVSHYWPEFAAAGKSEITTRWVLSHKAGLVGIDEPMATEEFFAWDPVVERLARQEPVWHPGQHHGYHPLTIGFLVGELVRRITGVSIGSFVEREIAEPLGLDLWIGLPADRRDLLAPLLDFPADRPDLFFTSPQAPGTLAERAFTNPTLSLSLLNDPRFHAAEIPAANGVTNARSVSRLFAACIGEVDGTQLLDANTMNAARVPQAVGPDRVLPQDTAYGLGFFLPMPWLPMAGAGSFGHDGLGGSLGFAHPELGLSFGYVMNQCLSYIEGDPRTLSMVDAVLASAGPQEVGRAG
jgi:CubicO group peptidase (beta-lactamase class C family)